MLQIIPTFILLLTVSAYQIVRHNVFLTEGESWLVFPHRQLHTYTYTARCKLLPQMGPKQVKQFEIVNKIAFNNTVQTLNIYVQCESKNNHFLYGRISSKGVLTIYQVNNTKIEILFERVLEDNFTYILMFDDTTIFMWNDSIFSLLIFFSNSNQIREFRGLFPDKNSRKCIKNKLNSLLCWNDDQLLLLTFLENDTLVQTIKTNMSDISMVLSLDTQNDIILICGHASCCSGILFNNQFVCQQDLSFGDVVVGGTVHRQMNKFVVIKKGSISFYGYILLDQIKINFQDYVVFPDEFNCSTFIDATLLSDSVLVQCKDQDGDDEKIILMIDKITETYVPFDPAIDISGDSWMGINLGYLFVINSTHITTHHKNFHYIRIANEPQQPTQIELYCISTFLSAPPKETYYEVYIVPALMNTSYTDIELSLVRHMGYNQQEDLYLKPYFKSRDIFSYYFSSNCSYIEEFQYKTINYMQYFSFYNRQKCVQILAQGGQIFYRLLQINYTLFYLEICAPLTVGYGCELKDIYDHVGNVAMHLYREQIVAFYTTFKGLVMQVGHNKKLIYEGQIQLLQKKESFLRIMVDRSIYFHSIDQLFQNKVFWMQEMPERRYFYSKSSLIELQQNGMLREYSSNGLLKQQLYQQLSFDPSSNSDSLDDLPLPYVIRYNDFTYVIRQQSIEKSYKKDYTTKYFSMPFNQDNLTITEVRSTKNYLTISYNTSVFEIYDMNEEIVSSRIVFVEEIIMTDIILFDVDTILIPIESSTTLIKIERNPHITLGNFKPEYSRFQQYCSFRVTLKTTNRTCPIPLVCNYDNSSIKLREDVYQEFSLRLQYYIQQIDLQTYVQVKNMPDQCKNCILQLRQCKYLGPIFSFDLLDDFYEQFVLIPHLIIDQCQVEKKNLLDGMMEVRLQDYYVTYEVITTDGLNLYFMGTQLNIRSQFPLQNTTFCSSYVQIKQKYLLLCDNTFLLVNRTGIQLIFFHNMTINYFNRNNYQLQYDAMNTDQFLFVVLINETKAHIYQLTFCPKQINFYDDFNFMGCVQDLKVINQRAIVLHDDNLCILEPNDLRQRLFKGRVTTTCYPLSGIIPKQYAYTYEYDELILYEASDSAIKILLLSKTIDNLHIDLQIDISNQSKYNFTIINVYSGYTGYHLLQIIAVNVTKHTYTYFVLLYESNMFPDHLLVAYYRFNDRFSDDGTIGQIRSAEMLKNHFRGKQEFNFISFVDQMYISQHNQSTQNKSKYRNCLSVKVKDNLQIILNYEEAPPLKFLILEAQNENQKITHYIKINFIPNTNITWECFVCLSVVVLLLVGLVKATNGCKNTDSDLEAQFLNQSMEVNDHPYFDISHQSSLIHSNSNASSDTSQERKRQNSEHSSENEQIIIIRQEQ